MNLTTKKNLLFSCLFTSILTPVVFFTLGLPMILQMKGYDASLIGLVQLAGLPMVFKFLISTPIDKIVFEKKHYKRWTFYIGLLYICLLVAMSFLSLEKNISLVFVSIFLVAFVSTFMDIPLNALSIKVFKKEERISAGSFKISAFSMAALLGSGVFLLSYNHLGWQNTLIILAVLIGFSLIALNYIEESDELIKKEKVSFKDMLTFFKQKNIGIWVFLLSFYFAFISALWVFMKPYLISKGLKPDEVVLYVGIYGSSIAVFGGMISNIIGQKLSKKILLILFMVVNILSVLCLLFIDYGELNILYLLVGITMVALSIALSSAIIFSIMMDYSRVNTRAIDYSVQSSLFSLTRIVSAIVAGVFISKFSFSGMFIFELVGMSIVLIVIVLFYKELK